ncbi:hypothetical protein F5B19DRAFT_62672, partial [Rostrohypoxylon terebratum]
SIRAFRFYARYLIYGLAGAWVYYLASIVDNRLFFSSGTYNFDDGRRLDNTYTLYWLPLNGTIDISGPVDVSLLGSVDLPSHILDRGTAGRTFFHDQNSLYPFDALFPYTNSGVYYNYSWMFDTTENMWSLVPVRGADVPLGESGDDAQTDGTFTSDPTTGRSFYVGGGFNDLIRFESSGTIPTLTTGKGIPPNDSGAMVYVRKGLAGLLLTFGGKVTLANSTFSPFSSIFIYDISSDTWYTQNAIGDIPNPRSQFCAGVSAAPDDSSFQVTIHGGLDSERFIAYNDVYVLTIPSFRWIKINDSGNPDLLNSDSTGRTLHHCDVWNETQLIVSGGQVLVASFHPQPTGTTSSTGTAETADNDTVQYINQTSQRQNDELHLKYDNNSNHHTIIQRAADDPLAADILNLKCNETYPPFKVLDTSTYTWLMNLNSNLKYTVPVSVSTIIGGNETGGAVLKAPLDGWSSRDLEMIFNKTVPRGTGGLDDKTPNDPTSKPTPGPTSNLERMRNGLSKGTIAGVAVGTTLAAIILIWALVWLKRYAPTPKKLVETVRILVMQDGQWHKPELDASSTARHELDTSEPRPRELHEEGVTKYELPGSFPSCIELP